MKKLNRRILKLIFGLTIIYFALIISFNALWHQPSPQSSLISLAELELEAKGVSLCENPRGHRREHLRPSEHDCRWWRLPYEIGTYCWRLNDLIKPFPNCTEIGFAEDTPEAALEVFLETFEAPCVVLERHKSDRRHATNYRNLRCDKGANYRQFTVYVLIFPSFKDDETMRFLREVGGAANVLRIKRTKIWQFI